MAVSPQGRQRTVDEEFQDELLLADWKLPLADSLGGKDSRGPTLNQPVLSID